MTYSQSVATDRASLLCIIIENGNALKGQSFFRFNGRSRTNDADEDSLR